MIADNRSVTKYIVQRTGSTVNTLPRNGSVEVALLWTVAPTLGTWYGKDIITHAYQDTISFVCDLVVGAYHSQNLDVSKACLGSLQHG